MKLTFLKLILLLIFSLAANFFAEGKITLHSPEYVQAGQQFELVFLHRVEADSNLKYEITFALSQQLQFGKCELTSPSKTEKISFKQIHDENGFSFSYGATIFPNQLGLKEGESFQILLRLAANYSSGVIINSQFVASLKGKIIQRFPKDEFEEDEYHQTEIKFYQPEFKAGKTLNLRNFSYLNFSINKPAQKIVIENWFKYEGKEFSFFHLLDQVKGDTLLQFAISKYRHLLISSKGGIDFLENKFLSAKTWHHLILILDPSTGRGKLFINSELASAFNLPKLFLTENLLFTFFNESEQTKVFLENLRIWESRNELDFFVRQKNYNSVKADSSSLLRFVQFESQDEFSMDNSVTFNFENLNYAKADAPIFSLAPEISVQYSASGYLIKWSGGDYSNAAKYAVERSLQGDDFKEIFSIQTDALVQDEYSFLSEFIPQNNFVYFRVKQLNKDGSVIYSQAIKIGQGAVENFEIKQNFPNPFNPKTSIKILVLNETEIEISVYNLSGKRIADLFRGALKKGEHSFEFDGTELPSGLYLYMVKTPAQSDSRKMILAK